MPRAGPVFVRVTYGNGSVLLWRRCDTLCTSGFTDDFIFAHNGQEQAKRAYTQIDSLQDCVDFTRRLILKLTHQRAAVNVEAKSDI